MAVTTEQIKELREITGVSVMQCKKALEEAEGDLEKAQIILRKLSAKSAEKKSDRELSAGTVASYIHANGSVGGMIELQCDTDFVAMNDDFKTLARDIAMHITASVPKYIREDEITDEERAKATEVFKEEVQDKPEEMQAQILEGKLASHFKESVLMNQDFIKDPSKTIGKLIEEGTQKLGERIVVAHMARFSVVD